MLAKADDATAISRHGAAVETFGKATRGALFMLGDAALTLASIAVTVFSWTVGARLLDPRCDLDRGALRRLGAEAVVCRAAVADPSNARSRLGRCNDAKAGLKAVSRPACAGGKMPTP